MDYMVVYVCVDYIVVCVCIIDYIIVHCTLYSVQCTGMCNISLY